MVSTEPIELVLPCAPNDEEKAFYLRSGRWFLMIAGFVSFASLSAGMILFVHASVYFWWFGLFFGYFCVYLLVSYLGVGAWGRDFDYEAHRLMRLDHWHYLPQVDVFLPICGEDISVIRNTWEHVRDLDWPDLLVHVLDDGDSTEARALAGEFGFGYAVRADRPHLKKAGNLRAAFARTGSPLIVIFDADFCPRPDFLREIVPLFEHEPKIAIVQTPQFFRVRKEQTWVERGAGIQQELWYRYTEVNRDRFGASVCCGTCAVYRRAALEPFGGTAAIGYSEDMHTGFSVLNAGWVVKYVPIVLSMGMCPDRMPALFTQAGRWSCGTLTLFVNPAFWTSKLSIAQKVCYVSGMLYYSATAIGIFTNPLPGALLVWVKPEVVLFYNVAFAIPSILFASVVMRLWTRQPHGMEAAKTRIVSNWAHLITIKDMLLRTQLEWVPTGGSARGKRVNKFKQAQWLCAGWVTLCTVATLAGSTLRIVQGYAYYSFLPTAVLAIANFALHLDFMTCTD